MGGYLLVGAALWRKFQINSWFFSTKGIFVSFFGRWTTLHSVLSMWWELQCLQEWNQRCVFGLLWHMFTCYRDPAMIVSMKHIERYKLFKGLDKQVTASAKEMYVKEKGGTTRTSLFRPKNDKCPFAHTALQKWGLDFPSAAEELFSKHLQPRTWVLYNWNGSPDLSVSFWANNRVASFNFSLKQFYLGPFLLG